VRAASVEATPLAIPLEQEFHRPQFTQLTLAGIEAACWDAHGRTLGVPTNVVFGGRVRDEVDFFGFVQGDTAEQLGRHAGELGVPAEERDVWPAELHVADAVFVTGSGAGLAPVGAVDGHAVATVTHPHFAAAVAAAYRDLTRAGRHLVPVIGYGKEIVG
jgi:L-alanine-DL-glutamate epimerase-like enolase superfamily enzyme